MTRAVSIRAATPAAVLFLFASMAVSLKVGAMPIAFGDLFDVLRGEANATITSVITTLRAPRLLLALIVGAGLAVASGALQALFRNPLADPGVLGVSSGATLGAALWIVLGAKLLHLPATTWTSVPVLLLGAPVCAFVGALGMTALTIRLGRSGTSMLKLLLVGIAMTALAEACIGIAAFAADDVQLRTLTFWRLGWLGGATWPLVAASAVIVIPASLVLRSLAGPLNQLALGERAAGHHGVDVAKLQRKVVVLVSIVVAGSVAGVGTIAFLGLVAPLIVRLAVGPDQRWVLGLGMVVGAALLAMADVVSRTLVAPAELPLGILTAFFGAPIFLGLVLRGSAR